MEFVKEITNLIAPLYLYRKSYVNFSKEILCKFFIPYEAPFNLVRKPFYLYEEKPLNPKPYHDCLFIRYLSSKNITEVGVNGVNGGVVDC